MKIVVASDCHGEIADLKHIFACESDADLFLFAGDSFLSEEEIHPFIGVKGNGDFFSSLPDFRIITTPFGRLFISHGHKKYLLSFLEMKKKEIKIVISGHTHIHRAEFIEDVWFFNPGSTSRPRDGTNGTYLVLLLDESEVKYNFKKL